MSGPVMRNALVAMLLLPLLAACSSDPENRALVDEAKDVFARIGAPKAPSGAPVLTAEAVAAAPVPLITVEVEADARGTVFARMASNQGVETYGSADMVTLSMRDGVVVSTRGFGNDLMSSQSPTAAAIVRGQGSHRRSLQTLDGLDQTRNEIFDCALSATGGKSVTVAGRSLSLRGVTETCRNSNSVFSNEFMVDGNGRIRQSRQWIGMDGGFLRITGP